MNVPVKQCTECGKAIKTGEWHESTIHRHTRISCCDCHMKSGAPPYGGHNRCMELYRQMQGYPQHVIEMKEYYLPRYSDDEADDYVLVITAKVPAKYGEPKADVVEKLVQSLQEWIHHE